MTSPTTLPPATEETAAEGDLQRVWNFNAGPSVLPLPVLREIQSDLLALPGVGKSILEISHRSKHFQAILDEAEANLGRLLGLGDAHRVLFLPGGATLQFSMVPMTLLRSAAGAEGSGSADYIVTGSWGAKAVKEAAKEGTARVAWNGSGEGYVRVPEAGETDLDPNAAYVHFTSNETIQGVEFFAEPEVGDVPLVCDASSDFLSRPLPMERYGLLYAGAQKNAGPAGVTVVIVREDLVERAPDGLASMLDYRNHIAKDSAYNTPPVFAIYALMLVTRWLLDEMGGLAGIEERNREKAERLYRAIDESGGFYRGHARPEARSRMNVAFTLAEPELETLFLTRAEEQGLSGLKGHRSVGGVRASLYNAMPPEGVSALIRFMDDFRRREG